MSEPGSPGGATALKCVVWDLDRTLIRGVWLERRAGEPAEAEPALLAAAGELAARGVLQAVASRNPPQIWPDVRPALAAVTFVAVELGWQAKSESIRRIAERLDLGLDAIGFVDDDPYERAEVAANLPSVTVLRPEQVAEALTWPSLSPPEVTAEGARRAQMYLAQQERARRLAGAGGSRAEVLRQLGTRIDIRPAAAPDVARLHELSVRTHRFNATGDVIDPDAWGRLLADPACRVEVVGLSDRFVDDGIVGVAVIRTGDDSAWSVPALMMSCRAIGRGVIDALLGRLVEQARAAGATHLDVACRATERNIPLRLALAAAGFSPPEPEPERERERERGAVTQELAHHRVMLTGHAGHAGPPSQAAVIPGEAAVSLDEAAVIRDELGAELRRLLVSVTGRPELLGVDDRAPLLTGDIALGSLRGTLLLGEIRTRYGVDVAELDVNLECLGSLGELTRFVRHHRPAAPIGSVRETPATLRD